MKEKKKEIEKCLENLDWVNLEQWQDFAKGKAGLISGEWTVHNLFTSLNRTIPLLSSYTDMTTSNLVHCTMSNITMNSFKIKFS